MKSTDKELFDLLTGNNEPEEVEKEEVLEVEVQEEEYVDEAFMARCEKDAAAQKLWRDAKAGDAGSQQELGDELFRQKRYAEAFEWYRKAAAQKYELAYYDLGWSYHYGLGTDIDFRKAIKYYKKYDAIFDDANIQYQIGRSYELGLNDNRNAEKWYQKAADNGEALAELALQQMKMVAEDNSGPEEWFEKGRHAFWDISSHRDVIDGKVYNFVSLGAHHDTMRHLEALRWWHKAAVHGHAESQFYLALHVYQRWMKRKSPALLWFTESAKNGYAEAQAVLANKYKYGEGAEINERKARMWRKKAANNTGDDNVQKTRKASVSSGKMLKRILFLAVTVLAIVLVRRMDQMSYKSVSEADAVALAQKVTVAIPDQEIKLLGSDKTRKLQIGTRVKVLGVYKQKLNKGNSPRVYWTSQEYLIELPDGKRGHGPLMETALGQRTILPTGDTAVITSVRKLAKAPKVWANGRESRYQFAYTLKGHKGQYALEDLKMFFPQRVTYLAEGLTPKEDTSTFLRKVEKFFTYDIRPVTRKPGYFLFPKYQIWNEFLLQYWFRVLMIVVAYILELLIIFRWIPRLIRGR